MATFADIFNQAGTKLDQGMNSPWTQLGLQLMQQGGWQAGDPSTGQRLGVAGMGFMQQRAEAQQQQQLMAYRKALLEQQQQAAEARQAEAQRQAEFQQRLQDPEFLAQLGPMARAMATFGADPQQVISAHNADNQNTRGQAQLDLQQQRFEAAQARGQGGGAKAPTPRQIIDEPLPNGMVQRHKYNSQTGGYDPFGAPFSRSSGRTQKADPLTEILNGVPTENQGMPDTNASPGPAVPGLPGTVSIAQQAPASNPAPLVMAGASPQARKSGVDSIVDQITQQIAEPQTAEEYAQLPKGTRYRDPVSGRVATKR